MCGICGVIQVDGEPRAVVDPAVLDRMTDAMRHRGPDDRGTYQVPGAALGVRRLSIVDVHGGHQPVANETQDVWAIQNGELYNHEAIRRELVASGHGFQTRCDTEILPHLYERDGVALPVRLRGKFALAVWDNRTRRALIARDRLGVKPLYWTRRDDVVVFASELKSLLASGLVEPRIDYGAVDAYLSFGFVPAPHTPLVGVRKLLPGSRLVVEAGAVREESYWSYPIPEPDTPTRPEAEYAEGVLGALREAVRLRLMSDVPLGAMLSGGLDSSLVVALMAEEMSEPVKTFSVGFREDEKSNELADARYVASLFGTDHHELELSFVDDTTDLPDLVRQLDEPLADLSALGFLALSRLAREHVTVALSGQGADELLGGYERYRNVSIAHAWRRLPTPVRRTATAVMERGPSRTRRVAEVLSPNEPVERTLALYGKVGRWGRELRAGPLLALDRDTGRSAVARIVERSPDGEPLATALFVDAQLSLPDDMLHYFDRASMAHSLEVRVPFLDHELVEYCARIPSGLKVRRLTTKHVLKQAARRLLPSRIVDKPKIGFFNRSIDAWLEREGAVAVRSHLIDRTPAVAEFVDMDSVTRFAEGTPDQRASVFRVLILELWLETYLPARPRPSMPRDAG